MAMILRHMAKVALPPEQRLRVLGMYRYEGYGGQDTITYRYKDGIAYLPLNREKLAIVSKLLGEEIIDERSKGAPLDAPFIRQPEFSFRDYQVEPAEKLVEYIDRHQYGTFSAGCGTGKTVMCAYAGGMSGMKNLVLLDQTNLVTNWEEAYQLIWGKTPELLTPKIKHLPDVAIATFQMLHKNPELLHRIQSAYGHCNIDEAHTVKAKTFTEVMFRLSNFRRVATSATFYSKYLPTEVLVDICGGPVAVTMVDHRALKCLVRFIATEVRVSTSDPTAFTAKVLPALAGNDERNNRVVSIIGKCSALNRRIIVIAITQEQAEYLAQKLEGVCSTEVYVGSTSKKRDKELKDNFEAGRTRCVITCKKFNKGTDFPSADTIIFANPSNNKAAVEQLRGRIVRSAEVKPEPWVFDLVDSGSITWRWAANRHAWYRGLGDRFDKPDYVFLEA